MTFMDDYRQAMIRYTPTVDAPPTVGIRTTYTGTARPYMRKDAGGVTIVMPASKVGTPPQSQVFTVDDVGQWHVNLDAMGLVDVVPSTMWTNPVDGAKYRVQADGRVFQQANKPATPTYQDDRAAAGVTGWYDTQTPGVPAEQEVYGDAIPKTVQRQYPATKTMAKIQKDQKITTTEDSAAAASTGTFGVTSPGGPSYTGAAGQGGPTNPADWYGSEDLATGVDPATYAAQLPDIKVVPKALEGTAMERFRLQQLQAEGWGRPMYAPDGGAGDVATIMRGLANDASKFANVQMEMKAAGILPKGWVVAPVLTGDFAGYLTEVLADANLSGMPYEDFLSTFAEAARKQAAAAAKAAANQTTTSTNTSSSVSLTSRASAEQILKDAWTQKYGRAPSEAQLAQFSSTLRGAERADPSVTTTTTTTSGTGDSTSDSVTKQSQVEPTSEAMDYADEANPRKAKEYAALNYFNILGGMSGMG